MKKFKILVLILGLFFIFSAQSCEPDPIKVEFQNAQHPNIRFQAFKRGTNDYMKGFTWVKESSSEFTARINKEIDKLEKSNHVILKTEWIYDGYGDLRSCMIQYRIKEER